MIEKEKLKIREDEIATMAVKFCKERLDDEYAQLCVKMERKLGRIVPSRAVGAGAIIIVAVVECIGT